MKCYLIQNLIHNLLFLINFCSLQLSLEEKWLYLREKNNQFDYYSGLLHESFLTTYYYETGSFILGQQRRVAGCYQGQVQEKSENSFPGWVGSLDTIPDIFDYGNNF